MNLHVLSDIHTEFSDFEPPDARADVIVLAGDIGVGTGGIEWAAERFPETPVVYVPGNHEYYGHDIITGADRLRKAAPPNVHVLDNDALMLDGVRFLGATFWTDFEFDGAGEARTARERAKRLVRDFTSIRNGGRPFTPADSVELHRKSVAWLVDALEKPCDGETVVVTHHLPASGSVADEYGNSPLNPAFASRLEGLIRRYQPELWIHGHTHAACDYDIDGTRVVCNPRGYPSEAGASAFLPGLIVEV